MAAVAAGTAELAQRPGRGQVDGHERARRMRHGPGTHRSGRDRLDGTANRQARGAHPHPETMLAGCPRPAASSAAPRSVMKDRSPSRSTSAARRPVARVRDATGRMTTPWPRNAAVRRSPQPSRPTPQMSTLRPPSRANERATLAAEPPCRNRISPATSVPRSTGITARTTTSSIRSPRHTSVRDGLEQPWSTDTWSAAREGGRSAGGGCVGHGCSARQR